MEREVLDILYVVILVASTIWVFNDARKRKAKPIFWSIITAFGLYPLGFVYYLARARNDIMQDSYPTAEDFKKNTTKE